MEHYIITEYSNMVGLADAEDTLKRMGYDYVKSQVLRSAIHQAHKECLIKSLKSRLHLYYEEYLDSEEFLLKFPHFRDCKDKAEKITSRYIFLTVNPEPTITLKMFRDTIEKAVSKKWLINYVYVLEQRGDKDEEMGRGFHAHFIIDTDGKKYHEAIRELKNTFKKVCDVSYNCVFNIRNIKEEQFIRFIKYIVGIKNQIFKHSKQNMDKIWRDTNHIANYYSKGDISQLISKTTDFVENLED